jgi:hypothetical protein
MQSRRSHRDRIAGGAGVNNYWFEIAIVSTLFGVGNILFSHFEEGTPKWRRIGKLGVFWIVSVAISHFLGRIWFFVFLAACLVAVLIIHFWYLPKLGIHPLTAEPKRRYYELRKWHHLLERLDDGGGSTRSAKNP